MTEKLPSTKEIADFANKLLFARIEELMHEGYPWWHAVAIAYNEAQKIEKEKSCASIDKGFARPYKLAKYVVGNRKKKKSNKS